MPHQEEAAPQRVTLSAPRLNEQALSRIHHLIASTQQLGVSISQDPFLQRRETLVSLIENQVTCMEVHANWHYLQVSQDLPILGWFPHDVNTVNGILDELRQRTYGYASFAAGHRLHQQAVDLLRTRLRERDEDDGHREGDEDHGDDDNADSSSSGDDGDGGNQDSEAHIAGEDSDGQESTLLGEISRSTTVAPNADHGRPNTQPGVPDRPMPQLDEIDAGYPNWHMDVDDTSAEDGDDGDSDSDYYTGNGHHGPIQNWINGLFISPVATRRGENATDRSEKPWSESTSRMADDGEGTVREYRAPAQSVPAVPEHSLSENLDNCSQNTAGTEASTVLTGANAEWWAMYSANGAVLDRAVPENVSIAGYSGTGAASYYLAQAQDILSRNAGMQVQRGYTNGLSGTNMGGEQQGEQQGGQQALD